MGLDDGVSKVWIMRARGGLQIEGYKDDLGAIAALIRHALVFGPPETRTKIESTVTEALKHLDDRDEDEPAE